MGFPPTMPQRNVEKSSPCCPHLDVDAGGLDGGLNLGARTDDAGVLEAGGDVLLGEAGDFRGIEVL